MTDLALTLGAMGFATFCAFVLMRLRDERRARAARLDSTYQFREASRVAWKQAMRTENARRSAALAVRRRG